MDLMLPKDPKAPENRRRCGRLGQEMLKSSVGPVRDLSVTGMRVTTKRGRAPRGPGFVRLQGFGMTVKVLAVPCWIRRTGRTKLEVGFRFVDVDEKTAKALNELGRVNRVRRTL